MVHLWSQDAEELMGLVTANVTVRLRLEPTLDNPMRQLYDNWLCWIAMRMIVPLLNGTGFGLAWHVLRKSRAEGPSCWGSTRAWVAWLELVPCLLLAFANAFGLYLYGTSCTGAGQRLCPPAVRPPT